MTIQTGQTYKAVITGQEFKENDYGLSFNIRLRLVDDGHNCISFLSLMNKDGSEAEYSAKSREVLAYLGLPKPDFSLIDSRNAGHLSFVGKEVEAFFSQKEKWYINTPRSGSSNSEPADSKSIRMLNSLHGKDFKELLREQSGTTVVTPAPQAKPKPAPAGS